MARRPTQQSLAAVRLPPNPLSKGRPPAQRRAWGLGNEEGGKPKKGGKPPGYWGKVRPRASASLRPEAGPRAGSPGLSNIPPPFPRGRAWSGSRVGRWKVRNAGPARSGRTGNRRGRPAQLPGEGPREEAGLWAGGEEPGLAGSQPLAPGAPATPSPNFRLLQRPRPRRAERSPTSGVRGLGPRHPPSLTLGRDQVGGTAVPGRHRL